MTNAARRVFCAKLACFRMTQYDRTSHQICVAAILLCLALYDFYCQFYSRAYEPLRNYCKPTERTGEC